MHPKMKSLIPMLITCLSAGVLLSLLAPYSTHKFSTVYRFMYWIGLCLAGGFGAAITDLIVHWRNLNVKPWPLAIWHSITSTLAVASIILLGTLNSFGKPDLMNFFSAIFYIWVIAITISSIGALLNRRQEDESVLRPTLYDRLPPKLRSADIYALAAEDHYVRVITSKGDDLILMRLSDAIKETTPLKGLSPHRSWWVSESAVDKATKSEIVLHSGQAVPISRTGLKHVRAAGWI